MRPEVKADEADEAEQCCSHCRRLQEQIIELQNMARRAQNRLDTLEATARIGRGY